MPPKKKAASSEAAPEQDGSQPVAAYQSSDEPYKDHGDRHEGVSSKHSDDNETESKLQSGWEKVKKGVMGRVSGNHQAP